MSPLSTRPGRVSILFPIVILALLILLVVVDADRRAAKKQLSINVPVADQENKEKAKAVVAEVRKLMDIPATPEPTVATIVDVKKLQSTNPFYSKAQNGDYLIVTQTRAILYSQKLKKILDVVPVQVQADASSTGSKASVTSKATASKAAQ